MGRLRNLAELDYASTIHPLAQKVRSEEIHNARSPVHRLGARIINRVVVTAPDISAKLLGARTISEVNIIGNGAQIIVLRDGDSVVKVDQRTLALSPQELQETAAIRQEEHDALRQYLGEIVLPETVSIEPHPLLPRRNVLVVRQAFQPFHDPHLFDPGTCIPRPDAFQQMSQRQPRHGVS